mmetsp:Transcript_8625/g.18777  ORF Transcript_8625/g.18777 Transcript_8625/m.18777 type:complete len:224 (-) Transcript_8625:538-1209(-)|eukprot:6176158-Pleurochrysis_carterae.AAC.1
MALSRQNDTSTMSWFLSLARQRSPPDWEDTLHPGPLTRQLDGSKYGSVRSRRTDTATASSFGSSVHSLNTSVHDDQSFVLASQYDGSKCESVRMLRTTNATASGISCSDTSVDSAACKDQCSVDLERMSRGEMSADSVAIPSPRKLRLADGSFNSSTCGEDCVVHLNTIFGCAIGLNPAPIVAPRKLRMKALAGDVLHEQSLSSRSSPSKNVLDVAFDCDLPE